jgi:hypothetical protein
MMHQQRLLHACRFVNSQASKWQFRAGQIEQAEKTAAMFTKDGDQANNLHDMQCMWYEIECGRAHLRRQNYGKVGLPNTVSFACRILLACSKDHCDVRR